MLTLPSLTTALPLDIGVLSEPPELLPAASPALPIFAGLLAASDAARPAAGATGESVSGEVEAPESPATEQAWALVLVPELANLPAEVAAPASPLLAAPPPETGAAAGDLAGRGMAPANNGPWPLRAAASPRLASEPQVADPGRVRGWQQGLPSVPITAAAPPAADLTLRTVTGQPVPTPTADQPPWYDPAQAPPWFDPANPPPAWSDPARPAPLWHDPTHVPPAWLDPARVPAAWFDGQRPTGMAPGVPPAAAPAVATAAPAAVLPVAAAAPTAGPVAAPLRTPALASGRAEPVAQAPRPDRMRRVAITESPGLAEPPQLVLNGPPPALAALPAAPAVAPPAASEPTLAPRPLAAEPAFTIASERLGEVAVRLSGAPDQLQVAMQAQPGAAALIGADAPRLSQDLAAAGVALAGLSINGQRADLSGGQRERPRQSATKAAWRDDPAPIAATRRPVNRAALTIDRFA